MKIKKKAGCKATEHNKELVRAAMIELRKDDPFKVILKKDVIKLTKLSHPVVAKYVNQILVGK